MLIINSATHPAALRRRAAACRAEWAYQLAATSAPLPAVGPTGLTRFVEGSGLPVAPSMKGLAARIAVPTAASTNAASTTVRTTDQTQAVATGAGSLGNYVRRRPPV